jgi:hypothetical protein
MPFERSAHISPLARHHVLMVAGEGGHHVLVVGVRDEVRALRHSRNPTMQNGNMRPFVNL